MAPKHDMFPARKPDDVVTLKLGHYDGTSVTYSVHQRGERLDSGCMTPGWFAQLLRRYPVKRVVVTSDTSEDLAHRLFAHKDVVVVYAKGVIPTRSIRSSGNA